MERHLQSCNLVSCIPFNPLSFIALHPLHPLLAFYLAAFCLFCCTNPHGQSFYLPLPRVARFWAPPLTSRNPFKFKGFTNTAHIHKKRLQGIKNDSKKCPKAYRKSSKSVKRLKMKSDENNDIHYVFERFRQQKPTIICSKIIKNRACNPNMLFDTSTHIKYQKVPPKWSQ